MNLEHFCKGRITCNAGQQRKLTTILAQLWCNPSGLTIFLQLQAWVRRLCGRRLAGVSPGLAGILGGG